MTSKRPPRRDPRAEDSVTPPADDLSARRTIGNRPPLRENAPRVSTPAFEAVGREGELGQLLARLGDAEAKRRRAEAFADSLAQKLVTLEAEVRGEREKRASEVPASPPLDAAKKVQAALEEARAAWQAQREELEAASEIALRSERELLTRERAERAEREAKVEMALRMERERIGHERTAREEAEGARDLAVAARAEAEAALVAADKARVAADAARVQAFAERDAARKALEVSVAEARQLRAALDAMTRERDQSAALLPLLSQERDEARRVLAEKSAAFETAGPRVHNAAMSAARAVITRLERHEHKLASLRSDALRRVLALLSEADTSGSKIGPLPLMDEEPFVSEGDRKTGSVPPPPTQTPVELAAPTPEASGIAPRPNVRTLDTPSPRLVKRTQQGLAVLPRGAFVDPRTSQAASPPPLPVASDELEEPASSTIEIEVD